MTDPAVHIGEAAALYDLAPSTLRWWEKQGVVPEPGRQGRQRLYGEKDLRRLGLAYLCRVTGMMPLGSAAVVTSEEIGFDVWQKTIKQQVGRLEQQIEQLTGARDYLNHLLLCEGDDITECPLLDVELLVRTPRGRVADPGLVAAARAAARAGGHAAATPSPSDETAPGRRDETPTAAEPKCATCELPVTRSPRGRPRRYCSRACQQQAYRTRRRAQQQTH